MSKSKYPETIYFHNQSMTSRISLKEEFKIERKAMRRLSIFDKDNKYIPAEKQVLFMLRFSETLEVFVDDLGKPLEGEFNFIITCEDNPKILYSATEHHSYLANGKKVLGSGCLFFNEGYLEIMSNNSGHYRPKDNEMLDAIKALYIVSGNELISYRSYSTDNVVEYSIEKLLNVDSFDAVEPCKILEPKLLSPEKLAVTNYDGEENAQSDNRHNYTLNKDLLENYKYIIEYGHSLFIPTPTDEYESIPKEIFVDSCVTYELFNNNNS